MTRGIVQAAAGIGATVLLLAGCSSDDGNGDSGDGNGSDGANPVATEMRSWDACEVLDNLQPFTEFMGIEEYTATVSGENVPDSAAYGESTLDPDAIVCGGGIDLGEYDGISSVGGLDVRIVPWEDDEKATESYETRLSSIEGQGDVEQARIDLGDPWDEGLLLASTAESGSTEYLSVVARDGQWLLHINLEYTGDYNAQNGGEPYYQFTNDELHQWLIDTYLPETNQAINDRIAEGTGS